MKHKVITIGVNTVQAVRRLENGSPRHWESNFTTVISWIKLWNRLVLTVTW